MAITGQINKHKHCAILIVLCILFLSSFLNKAFHIDDPLFLWTARQIQSHPFDFYGFTVNWYGTEMPMFEVAKNPPLASYYIALMSLLFGWSEVSLHSVFLLPACAVIVGTYLLAVDLCDRPLFAALISMSTPVFILSGTTLMCDMLMLSFWVFAVWFWRRGIKSGSYACLALASLLIAASSLTKYSGANLIPLLFAYALLEKRRISGWIVFLVAPLLLLCGYQLLTYALYGNGLLGDACEYAIMNNGHSMKKMVTHLLTCFSFTGGCFITALFYLLYTARKGRLIIFVLSLVLILVLLMGCGLLDSFPLVNGAGANWLFITQFLVFVSAGTHFLIIAISDFWRNKNADSALISLWVFGTIVFTAFINWSVNGRSLLPIVPVFGVLLVRNYCHGTSMRNDHYGLALGLPLAASFVVALLVTSADFRWANTARDAARSIHRKFAATNEKVWYQGHWGFQYYIDALGGFRPVDYDNPSLKNNDLVVIPANNTCVKNLHKHLANFKEAMYFEGSGHIATMSLNGSAGFYSDVFGPLPFALSNDTTDKYLVFRMIRDKTAKFNY